MSFTSIEDGVQPEGQGAAPGDVPYADFLNRVPEEHRPSIEPIFQDWNRQIGRRFEDAATYRRQWEPYEQAGLHQWTPEDLASLVEFARQYQDPSFQRTWVQEQAQQLGLLGQEQGDGGLDAELVDPSVRALVEQQMGPFQQELEQLRQWRDQQEAQQSERQIADMLERQYQALTDQHGEIDRDVLESFAQRFVGEDPQNAMQRGFEALQKYRGSIEQAVLRGKLNQPGAPSAFGGAETGAQPPRTLRESQAEMIARLQARAAM